MGMLEPKLADVCPECNGLQTVVELFPGHADECLTRGECVEECPIGYEVEIPCPVCFGDGTLPEDLLEAYLRGGEV